MGWGFEFKYSDAEPIFLTPLLYVLKNLPFIYYICQSASYIGLYLLALEWFWNYIVWWQKDATSKSGECEPIYTNYVCIFKHRELPGMIFTKKVRIVDPGL